MKRITVTVLTALLAVTLVHGVPPKLTRNWTPTYLAHPRIGK